MIYDGRKVEKYYNEPPYLENYHSDYIQLAFFYQESDGKSIISGYYEGIEDQFGINSTHIININLWTLKLHWQWSWDTMIKEFITTWNHEYLHMLGITDGGMLILREMGMDL